MAELFQGIGIFLFLFSFISSEYLVNISTETYSEWSAEPAVVCVALHNHKTYFFRYVGPKRKKRPAKGHWAAIWCPSFPFWQNLPRVCLLVATAFHLGGCQQTSLLLERGGCCSSGMPRLLYTGEAQGMWPTSIVSGSRASSKVDLRSQWGFSLEEAFCLCVRQQFSDYLLSDDWLVSSSFKPGWYLSSQVMRKHTVRSLLCSCV